MFRSASAQLLSCFSDVRLWTVVAKQNINNVFGFAIHGLLDNENFAILHFNAIAFDNVGATLAIMARVVAFRDAMLFLLHREV